MPVRVFISSTYVDLERHRRAVAEVIDRFGYRYESVEHFGSRPQEPTEACLQEVEQCDLFVGIYAHRYGRIPQGQGLSITEQEFDHARRLGRPCYCYRVAPDHPWPPRFIDEGEAKAKLQAFLEEKVDRLVRSTFTTPEDLATEVAADLGRHISQLTGETLRPVPTLIPCPPDPYFAHPYPLQENFTGRIPERQTLTEWLAQDPRPLLAMVAIGGMGKTALAWYWLQEDVLWAGRGPEGVLWWSFYDRDSTFEAFLERAIIYASGGQVYPTTIPSTRERMDRLKSLLYQRPFLIVLDGVERALRAYASLKAPYQGEAILEDPQGDFRACADPNLGLFLQWMASGYPHTKTLLTSRLPPRELEGLAGCRPLELFQMDPGDAVEFFRRQGVRGTRAEIEAACAPYGYHPLCLRLLSGMVAYDPQRPGDIAQAPRHDPLPHLKGKEHHHILEAAYGALDRPKRELLSRLAAFRTPLDYQAAALFNPYKDQPPFQAALGELEGRGLLFFQRETGRYDLHPVVRAYAYDRLKDRKGVHARLAGYFAALPPPERAESLEELAPVIELYHHTVGAGHYDQARDLYYERLRLPLFYSLGAYQAIIELLGGLFPEGEEKGPRLKDEGDQAWTLNELANAYSLSGRPARAVPLFQAHNAIRQREGEKTNLAVGLSNLADGQAKLGELGQAEESLRRSIELSREAQDQFGEGVGHTALGLLLALRGEWGASGQELGAALAVDVKMAHRQGQGLDWAYRAWRALLRGRAGSSLAAARRARELAEVERHERDFVRAEWLLGAARRLGGDLEGAEGRLGEALRRCRRINLVEMEPDILLETARLRRDQARAGGVAGLVGEAGALAGEALAIADRCGYRLAQADLHNLLAQLALDQGDLPAARAQAEMGRERASCGYRPALREAQRLLREVGQAERRKT